MGYVPLLETMGTKLLAVHHKISTLETSWFAPHTLCEAGGFLVRVRSESTSRSTQTKLATLPIVFGVLYSSGSFCD